MVACRSRLHKNSKSFCSQASPDLKRRRPTDSLLTHCPFSTSKNDRPPGPPLKERCYDGPRGDQRRRSHRVLFSRTIYLARNHHHLAPISLFPLVFLFCYCSVLVIIIFFVLARTRPCAAEVGIRRTCRNQEGYISYTKEKGTLQKTQDPKQGVPLRTKKEPHMEMRAKGARRTIEDRTRLEE